MRAYVLSIGFCAAVATLAACEQRHTAAGWSAKDTPAGSAPLVNARTIESNDRRWRVAYTTNPSPIVANQPFTIAVRVESISKMGSDEDVALAADAAMPEHGHGMNVEPKVTSRGGGVLVVEGMDFHMPGRWELYLDITRDGVTSRAQDEITLE